MKAPRLLRILCLINLGIFSLSLPSNAIAEEGWEFTLAPYLWTSGLSGDVRTSAGGPTASIDLSIKDVLDNLNLGLMGTAEAKKGRFSIVSDLFYANISKKDDVTVDTSSTADIKVGAKTFFGSLGAGYDLYSDERALVTGYASLRYWDVENELRVIAPAATFDQTVSENWVDPLVGVGASYDLGDGFLLRGYADIGGAGVGSDLTWSLLGLAGYQFNESVTAYAGWRYLSVDYDDDGFLFDVSLSGPLVGVAFKF
jgi:hypothetical protein